MFSVETSKLNPKNVSKRGEYYPQNSFKKEKEFDGNVSVCKKRSKLGECIWLIVNEM